MKSDFIKNTKEYFPNDLIENDFLLSFNCEGSTVLDVRDNKEIVSRTKNLPSEKGTLDAVVIHELLLVGGESAKALPRILFLKERGTLYFGMQSFLPLFLLKWKLARMARSAGFAARPEIYIASPSFLVPRFLIPAEDKKALAFIITAMTAYRGMLGAFARVIVKIPGGIFLARSAFGSYSVFIKK